MYFTVCARSLSHFYSESLFQIGQDFLISCTLKQKTASGLDTSNIHSYLKAWKGPPNWQILYMRLLSIWCDMFLVSLFYQHQQLFGVWAEGAAAWKSPQPPLFIDKNPLSMSVYVSGSIYFMYLCVIFYGLSQGLNGLTTAAARVWAKGAAA